MFNVGPAEILVILLLALIVFGPKRLPEIGKTVGKGLREFRQATQDVKDELSRTISVDEDDDEPEKSTSSPAKIEAPAPSSNGESGTASSPPVSGEAASGT